MITLIAAALAATQAPAPMPAEHAQHQQMATQGGDMSKKEKCCCEEMMEKMHSGHDMNRMQDHQEQRGK